MARDSQSEKMRRWAKNGDRATPESLGVSRAAGFDITFSQRRGNTPSRAMFNQIMLEITSCLREHHKGATMQFALGFQYIHPAFVLYNNIIYKTVTPSQINRNLTPANNPAQWAKY